MGSVCVRWGARRRDRGSSWLRTERDREEGGRGGGGRTVGRLVGWFGLVGLVGFVGFGPSARDWDGTLCPSWLAAKMSTMWVPLM